MVAPPGVTPPMTASIELSQGLGNQGLGLGWCAPFVWVGERISASEVLSLAKVWVVLCPEASGDASKGNCLQIQHRYNRKVSEQGTAFHNQRTVVRQQERHYSDLDLPTVSKTLSLIHI